MKKKTTKNATPKMAIKIVQGYDINSVAIEINKLRNENFELVGGLVVTPIPTHVTSHSGYGDSGFVGDRFHSSILYTQLLEKHEKENN